MAILAIHNVDFNHEAGTCQVEALVEDACIILRETLDSPAEYGPGLCQASFIVNDEYPIPENESQFIDFLDELDLDWEPIRYDAA